MNYNTKNGKQFPKLMHEITQDDDLHAKIKTLYTQAITDYPEYDSIHQDYGYFLSEIGEQKEAEKIWFDNLNEQSADFIAQIYVKTDKIDDLIKVSKKLEKFGFFSIYAGKKLFENYKELKDLTKMEEIVLKYFHTNQFSYKSDYFVPEEVMTLFD